MANFARSLKSPYLSPRLRPSMPGRTVSSSSDVPTSSPLSEDFADAVISGRNTPTLPSRRGPGRDWLWEADEGGYLGSQIRDDYDNASASSSRPGTPRSHANNSSHPIAIELPQHRRFSTAPARTPPEALSARGDLPGGYFPLHEDPNSRVHRPHPFQAHHDARMARHQSLGLVADRPTSHPATTLSMTQSNTPVASFLPAGFHDSPLPMGKYYPSNYEQRNTSQTNLRQSIRGSLSPSSTSTTNSDGTLQPSDRSHIATPESEIQRKLQQYQRDMVAQASMAANEILSSSVNTDATPGNGRSFGSVHIQNTRFTAPAPLKPISPKLLPLGSPGPVTPMTLESAGGCYLSIKRVESARDENVGASNNL
ncbi:hypothetical protein B0J13DRAFT_192782 [Dactylonectria estremocensis]|uniref:Uncharacterized protein n=1 Tax=Dactylonectria estremocensis TaxID=1079267 RepID=A0A9P9JFF5_9HYPO|nr:hypothetical protein B0J13DRAFT_192782 [Dactylonectria estremocensis]